MLSKAKVLVIGGSGFIGRNLIHALSGRVAEIRNLDVVPHRSTEDHATHWPGSFLQTEILREAMTGVDLVYHLAATAMPRKSNQNPQRDCRENVVGTLSVLDTAVALNIRRLVFTSSGGTVYGPTDNVPIEEGHPTNPITAYGISKLACEKYLRLYDGKGRLSTLSLRVANPYGPFQNLAKAQGALTTFCHQAISEEPITIWGDGSVQRDFVHIRDVAEALVLAGAAEISGMEINIGSGQGRSLNDLLEVIGRSLGRDIPRSYEAGRSFDVARNYLDITRARELLGWTPEVALEDGIAELLAYFRQQMATAQPPAR